MIGIGVGIDYALFVVTRYRQGLQAGMTPEEAVVTAIDTSGRAVLFAGLTVIIALVGMLAMRLSFISGLGIGAAAVVAVTVLAAVTLLPAVLGFVGTNIDRLKLPWVHNDGVGSRETVWHRWSRFVQRHPWLLTIAGLAVVLALALPVLSLRLGFVDAGNDPTGTQTRQAYDTLAERLRRRLQRAVPAGHRGAARHRPHRGSGQAPDATSPPPPAWPRPRRPSSTPPARSRSCASTRPPRPRTQATSTLLHDLRATRHPHGHATGPG